MSESGEPEIVDEDDDGDDNEKCSVCGDVGCSLEETAAGHAHGRPKE